MIIHKKILAAACVLLYAALPRAGEETPYPLNPATQPLAVVRADRAALIRDILQTRQMRAFEAEKQDFSGKLPGAETGVASLRALLDSLADAGAENLWYCLLQEGAALARRTGGFGWDEPKQAQTPVNAPGPDPENGFADAAPLPSGATRRRFARDRETERALFSGAPGEAGRAEAWRGGLAAFLGRRDAMAGLFANSRPLFGVLSLATDIDFRSLLAQCNLSLPVSVQLELFNNAGDLGFEARLHNLLPPPFQMENSGRQTLLSFRRDPLLEVNLPAPDLFRRHMPFDAGVFALLNLDILALLPQTVNVTVWRKEDGTQAWAAAALVPDREAFGAQLRRAYALAEALALAGGTALSMDETLSPDGTAIRVLRTDGATVAASLAAGEGKSGYFLVSGAVEDLPDPRTIRRAGAERDSVARYRSVLDAPARTWLAKELAARARRHGKEIGESVWHDALPEKDSGYITLDGGDLVLLSRNGLLPFFLPLLRPIAGRLY